MSCTHVCATVGCNCHTALYMGCSEVSELSTRPRLHLVRLLRIDEEYGKMRKSKCQLRLCALHVFRSVKFHTRHDDVYHALS